MRRAWAVATVATAVTILFIQPAVPSLLPPIVPATAPSFTLYGTAGGGWSLTSGTETNPGPTITENVGDRVTVHLVSQDGAPHGLFVDFNDDGKIDAGDYSSVTGTDVTFTFTVPSAPGSHSYYCSIHSPDVNGNFVPGPGTPMYGVFFVNGKPSATFAAPMAGTSWTGGTAHNIVFSLSDEDPPTSLTVWVNYTYGGGANRGTIAGPNPGTANPNVVSWTPSGFSAADVVVNVTARDTLGAFGSTLSSPFEIDSTPPTIAAQAPAPNAVGVPVNSNLRVTWSEGMNTTATSAPNAFAVQRLSDGAWISGAALWSPDATLMTFTPSTPLQMTTQYEVNVNGTAKDDSNPGNAFVGPAIWRFTTGTAPDTTPPAVTNPIASPAIQEAGSSVTISADVTDNVAVASVTAHVTGPATDVNLTMGNPSGPTWIASRAYRAVGAYTFAVWALDSSGNAASAGGTFTIQDRTAPVIASVVAVPTSELPNGHVNLTAQVTDNGVLASVTAHVAGAGFEANLTMSMAVGTMWYTNRTYTNVGSYAFTVWALDAAGNAASKSGSFSIVQAPPLVPSMVMAHVLANGTIAVMWSAVTSGDVAGYNVYRGTSTGGPFTKVTTTSVPAGGSLEYVDRDVQPGVTYYYVVTSVDTSGNESPQSAAASATVAATPLSADYTLWIGAAVVVALVILGTMFLLRRRRSQP